MAGEEQSKKKQVMVAIDENECSKHALKWALGYLKDCIADSDFILFTSQPPLDLSYVYASSYGAACYTKKGDVNPKEAICDAVEKLGIDLLVVGSNGLSWKVLAITVLTMISAQFL